MNLEFKLAAISAMQGIVSQGYMAGDESAIARKAFALAEALSLEAKQRTADYNRPDRVKLRNVRKLAPELLEAVQECVRAERRRRAKLKPGSPASTYTVNRIVKLEALIYRALAG